MPEVISDTSPLQYLFQTGHLDLLKTLYGTIRIPEAVAEEIARGRSLGVPLPQIESMDWIETQEVAQPSLLPLSADLGAGEREVLALAVERRGSLALLDDLLARRYAKLLGVSFTGTLGVLLRAKREGVLTAIQPIIEELERLRFRLDEATRRAVLRLADEDP